MLKLLLLTAITTRL